MNMTIQHNIAAMNANRQLGVTGRKKSKSTEKLSSGYRVNRAADDAAGLAISEKMRRQIKGLTQAARNSQDGISMVQIADGALNEIHDMLQRANQLVIEGANGTLTNTDRGYIQQELDNLREEVNGISDRTVFNEIYVLKGGGTMQAITETYTPVTYTAQTQTDSDLPTGVSIDDASAANHYMSQSHNGCVSSTIDFGGLSDVSDMDGKGFYSTCCTCDDHYSITFDSSKSEHTVEENKHYTFTVGTAGCTSASDVVQRIVEATGGRPNNHYTMYEADGDKLVIYDYRSNVTAGPNSGKIGSGVTKEVATIGESVERTVQRIEGKNEIQLQVGAEAGQIIGIELPDIDSSKVGLASVSVMTDALAQASIDHIKNGLEYVSGERSRMGAYQNRLEHTINNLNNVVENTTAAESQIRDTDMSMEMVEYSNQNILEQAGMSMLSQANQQKQGILSLLQ